MTGIILAAGESRRMGKAKLTLELDGKTLLEHAIAKAQSLCSEVIVVVGAYPEIYSPIAEKVGARVVLNQDWQEGLGSSLRVGIGALSPDTNLALVLLGDQPFIPETHLKDLLKKQQETQAELVFSSYEGIQGPPVVIARQLFERAHHLKGDKGAKALKRADSKVEEVWLERYEDVDTPEDAAKLLKA